jgi:quercetin dioxygenase-like cupin family protein
MISLAESCPLRQRGNRGARQGKERYDVCHGERGSHNHILREKHEGGIMETIDLKKRIMFYPDRISREMLSDKPEMRIALMCLNEGQKLEPHKAPLRLLMYCVQGRGTFIIGDEKVEADEKTCILCDPMVPHGFEANKGEKLVVMAVVTPVE